MTRSLDGKPFSSKPATDAYRDGWDATFGPRAGAPVHAAEECACGAVGYPEHGHRAPAGWRWTGRSWECEACAGRRAP